MPIPESMKADALRPDAADAAKDTSAPRGTLADDDVRKKAHGTFQEVRAPRLTFATLTSPQNTALCSPCGRLPHVRTAPWTGTLSLANGCTCQWRSVYGTMHAFSRSVCRTAVRSLAIGDCGWWRIGPGLRTHHPGDTHHAPPSLSGWPLSGRGGGDGPGNDRRRMDIMHVGPKT